MNENKPSFSTLVIGEIGNNCYLVPGPVTGNLYIIDPGSEADADEISNTARSYQAREYVILLTHAHCDHIGACGPVAKALNIKKVYLDAQDWNIYFSPENHMLPYLPQAKDLPPVSEYEPNEDFEIIRTPGHSPGGVCLLFKKYNALFTGDTLFRGSVGRTDLTGGDYEALIRSIHTKLLPLPDELMFYPGHQYCGNLGEEKKSNPYLQDV